MRSCGNGFEPLVPNGPQAASNPLLLVQAIRPGRKLKDRYVIQEWVETGGFALVLKALDTELHDRPVIVKVLQEGSEDRDYLERKFSNEVKSLACLDHPGIVSPLDVGNLPAGAPFIVLQFVRGATLKAALQEGPIRLDRAADMFRQIGEALRAAHEAGITHRDLKPSNIMLQPLPSGRDHVKLIDFGISSANDASGPERSSTTRAIGTPPYMAPEQWSGKPVPASDIYALGIIAYEIVSGRQPFEWKSLTELVRLQEAGINSVPPRERLNLHPEVETLIVQALRPSPEDRPASASHFCNVLADAMLMSKDKNPDEPTVTTGPRPQQSIVDVDGPLVQATPTDEARPSGWLTRTRLALSGAVVLISVVIGILFFGNRAAELSKASPPKPSSSTTPEKTPEKAAENAPQREPAARPDPARIAHEALEEGMRLDASADYPGALKAFERSLSADPNSAEAYLARANTYRKIRLYQKAMADLERAIELKSDYGAAFVSLGGTYMNMQPPDYRAALTAFQKAVELNPDLAYAWHGLAFANLRLANSKAALANVDRALKLDKGLINAYRTRAEIERRLGKVREAAMDDRRYAELDKARRAGAARPRKIEK